MLGLDWQQILLHVFNFIILAAGLTFLLFRPVRKFMRSREEKYKKSAEEHARRTAEIAELEAERERKIQSLDGELSERRKRALEGAEKEKKKLLTDAQAEAEAIVSDGRRRTESERDAAFAAARDELGDIVIRSAEKLLAMESTPESDKALYDSYLRAAGSDVTLDGVAKRAAFAHAAQSAENRSRKAADRQAREEFAELVAEAARGALERESTPESDGALYDEFLKTVNGSGTNG